MTKGNRPMLLERCKKSVNDMLPADAEHIILPCDSKKEWPKIRIDALKLAPYVCFVDDDDVVVNNSIPICLRAMEENDVGVVFTDEALADLNGNITSIRAGVRRYDDNIDTPWSVHHLSVIQSNAVVDNLDHLLDQIDGVEWFIRSSAMKSKGALHVPIIGYKWTHHKDQASKHYPQFFKRTFDICRSGPIPQYAINM